MCRPQSLHRHPRLGPGYIVALFYFWKWCPYIFIFQGEASAVPGVARGDELATVSVGLFSFLLTWPSCSGVAAMASEQWPGHALLCQGWPLESLLVNGFKFWLPTCYCWLPTPIDWLLDREISVVLQQIWCFIIQCWVVVPLFKLVSYRLFRQSTLCRILWACHTWRPCVNLVLSQQKLPSLVAWPFFLKSAKLEAVWTCHVTPTVWWYQNVSRNRAEVEHMSKVWSESAFSSTWIWQPDFYGLNLWLVSGQTMQKNISYFWK